MLPLPTPLLTLLFALPALSLASPSPALLSDAYSISLVPRHTLFLRQLADLQTFDQALGGVKASPITNSGDPQRPFSVGGSTFDKFESASQRSCDEQFQGCQGVANGSGGGGGSASANQQKQQGGNGGGNSANADGNGGNQQKKQSGNGGGNQNQNNNGGNQQKQQNGNQSNGQNNNNNNGQNKDQNKNGKQKRQDGGVTVQQCDQQKSQCTTFQQSVQVKDFTTGVASTNIGPDPNFPDFDLICEG